MKCQICVSGRRQNNFEVQRTDLLVASQEVLDSRIWIADS